MMVKSFTIKRIYMCVIAFFYFNVFVQQGLKQYIERTFKIYKIVPHKHKYEIRNQVISRK